MDIDVDLTPGLGVGGTAPNSACGVFRTIPQMFGEFAGLRGFPSRRCVPSRRVHGDRVRPDAVRADSVVLEGSGREEPFLRVRAAAWGQRWGLCEV